VNDTSPEAAAQLDTLMAQRSGSDRVRMACEMFDLARALVVANIRAGAPTISSHDLRARLFERLYGGDFSEEERARIVANLR
jgi:CMP-2-keto-3-deoxyoctulosonic acid synthetase